MRQSTLAIVAAGAGVINVLDIPSVVLVGHLGQVAHLPCAELELRLETGVVSARCLKPTMIAAPGRFDTRSYRGARPLASRLCWLTPCSGESRTTRVL